MIGRMFENIMDWAMEGSAPWAVTKLLGVCIVGAGLIMTPIIAAVNHFSKKNQNEYGELVNNIDAGKNRVFRSVDDCSLKGISKDDCRDSFESAMNWSTKVGIEVSYSTGSKCAQNHGQCTAKTTMVPVVTMVGKVTVTNYVPQTDYYPAVVAWQAAQYDMKSAVPLYNTPDNDVAVRGDGKRFTLAVR